MTKTNNGVRELQRANRVSVVAEEGKYIGRFWKTHTLLIEVDSIEQEWKPVIEGLGKTAERELFRVWICENADKFGIEYDPADRRSENNKFPRKYENDEILEDTAIKMIEDDVAEWVEKIEVLSGIDLRLASIVADSIEEVHERNGKNVEPKYLNGNWAYANINLIVTVSMAQDEVEDTEEPIEGYVTMVASLVSGQLKKPQMTYTQFYDELAIDIPGVKVNKEELEVEDKPIKLTRTDVIARLDLDEDDVVQMNMKARKLIRKDGDHFTVIRYDEDYKITESMDTDKLVGAKETYKEWK